jgi:hypothetical protein
MTTRDEDHSELQVCARILRALAHRIRGDLSVITNDLAYIATLVDPSETERARNRCSRISTELAKINLVGSGEELKVTTLGQALRPFGAVDKLCDRISAVEVRVAQATIEQAVALLREIFGTWKSRIDEYSARLQLTLQLNEMPQVRVGAGRAQRTEYSSIGDFAHEHLGERCAVEAGVIDLIFSRHGWSVAVRCDEKLVVIEI